MVLLQQTGIQASRIYKATAQFASASPQLSALLTRWAVRLAYTSGLLESDPINSTTDADEYADDVVTVSSTARAPDSQGLEYATVVIILPSRCVPFRKMIY